MGLAPCYVSVRKAAGCAALQTLRDTTEMSRGGEAVGVRGIPAVSLRGPGSALDPYLGWSASFCPTMPGLREECPLELAAVARSRSGPPLERINPCGGTA